MVVSNALSAIGVADPERYVMDDPTMCPFALHHLVSVGKVAYGVKAGEWFTPSMAAKAVYECCPSDFPLNIRLHGDGGGTGTSPDFSKPVLLLFAVRLGIDGLEQGVQSTLKEFLKDSRCMGLVSGKKTSSYYIIGLTPDEKPLYMDPHELRSYGEDDDKCVKLHCNMPFASLNPSMAIALLLKSKEEYEDVLEKYSSLLNTGENLADGNYVCMEGEDDFCLVQENGKDEEDDMEEAMVV